MRHIAILSMFLAIPMGVIAIGRLASAYQKYRFAYLKTLRSLWLIELIQLCLMLVNSYILTNVYDRFTSRAGVVSESLYRLVEASAHLLWVYLVLLLFLQLFNLKLAKITRHALFVTAMLLLVSILALTAYSIVDLTIYPVLMGYILIVLGAFIYVLFVGGNFFLFARRTADKTSRNILLQFGLFYFIPLAILLIMAFFHLFYTLDNDFLLLFSALHSSLIYALTLFYLNRFIRKYQVGVGDHHAEDDLLKSRFAAFNLTKREQEVVMLICEGKTNQEIADILFLSLLTVKGYVFKIFQKTRVKNRVQLSNLFNQL